MFYRRKLLLALIEVFGGSLRKTDCQKLLFLFNQLSVKKHYDFFPHHYGSYSSIAYYDKKRLSDLGYLNPVDEFSLKTKKSFLRELDPKDQVLLKTMALELKDIRGRQLIRKVYLEYPHYACRSKIANDVLNFDDLSLVKVWWNTDRATCLFTLGYEGLTIDAYLNKLILNNVAALVDVRANPISMKYGFSKKTLKQSVESIGLTYIHLPQLGIPSALRKNLDSPNKYKELFKHYRTEILPTQTEALSELSISLKKYSRIALTCFEATPTCCHRGQITEQLQSDPNFNTRIVHL